MTVADWREKAWEKAKEEAYKENRQRALWETAKKQAKAESDTNRFNKFLTDSNSFFQTTSDMLSNEDGEKRWQYFTQDRTKDIANFRTEYDWAKKWMEDNKNGLPNYADLSERFEKLPSYFDEIEQELTKQRDIWGQFESAESAKAEWGKYKFDQQMTDKYQKQVDAVLAEREAKAKELGLDLPMPIHNYYNYYGLYMDYPQYSISDAKARDWYELVQPTGLPVVEYVRFVDGLKLCTNNSEKRSLINGMDLTSKQKRVLLTIAGL